MILTEKLIVALLSFFCVSPYLYISYLPATTQLCLQKPWRNEKCKWTKRLNKNESVLNLTAQSMWLQTSNQKYTDTAGKKMMWPGSNPDEEIDPQFNTVNKLSVSIDITNVRLSNAPGDFIFFLLHCFISITTDVQTLYSICVSFWHARQGQKTCQIY